MDNRNNFHEHPCVPSRGCHTQVLQESQQLERHHFLGPLPLGLILRSYKLRVTETGLQKRSSRGYSQNYPTFERLGRTADVQLVQYHAYQSLRWLLKRFSCNCLSIKIEADQPNVAAPKCQRRPPELPGKSKIQDPTWRRARSVDLSRHASDQSLAKAPELLPAA